MVGDNDWVYPLSLSDLTGSKEFDIYRVIEFTNTRCVIKRYFLVRPNGMAIALAKTSSDPDRITICQSYIYSIDVLLSAQYRRRVFPLYALTDKDYKHLTGSLYTPVLPSLSMRRDPMVYLSAHMLSRHHEAAREEVRWLDKVAIQGWFPLDVLTTLDVRPFGNAGFSIESAFLDEIKTHLERESTLALPEGGKTKTFLPFALTEKIAESPLHEFKATYRVDGDYRLVLHDDDIVIYDPFSGDIHPLEELCEYPDAERTDLLEMGRRVLDYLLDDGVTIHQVLEITIYRCLNDLVYIVLNMGEPHVPFLCIEMDLAKHLFVHYGYVDIPYHAFTPTQPKGENIKDDD